MENHNFAPAAPDEQIVYGACRPDYPSTSPDSSAVDEWVTDMQKENIERVCCLLFGKDTYDGLIETYQAEFGRAKVRHAPIRDYDVVPTEVFCGDILPFLQDADEESEKVVVHCSAGMGRTGHVLALWLVHGRGYELEDAIETVEQTGRNPLEAASVDKLRDFC